MRRMVVLVVLMVASFALAVKERPGPMLDHIGLSAMHPDRNPAKGEEFADIRAQQALLLTRGDQAGAKQLENQIQAILLSRQQPQPMAVQPVELPDPPAGWNGSFAPDQQVTTGPVYSFATDYEQDPTGTMWAAVGWGDSTVRVFKSEDHGASWPYVNGFYWPPKHPIGKLEMAVGAGDSNFVYVAELLPANDGDLAWSRINQDGTGLFGGGILSGPDSVTDFAFCRDYVSPYYLYAVAYNGLQEAWTDYPNATILRSTNYSRAWAITDSSANAHHPRLRAGAGSYIYLGAAPHVAAWDHVAQATLSPLYFSPGTRVSNDVYDDTFRVWDAVFAPAFTTPESTATAWIVYSHNYNGGADWDVLYAWTADAMTTWSPISDIAYTSAVEAYVDLKNYTSVGNTYMNASYVVTGTSAAYRTFSEASTPDDWATAEQMNQGTPVAWDYENTPQLVYSPFGPGTGAGLVFSAYDGSGVYFNAPWFTGGVTDRPVPRPGTALDVSPSVARGPVRVSWQGVAERLTVTDVTGRKVADFAAPVGSSLVWDGKVAAGTYFVRLVTKSGTATRPVVIQ